MLLSPLLSLVFSFLTVFLVYHPIPASAANNRLYVCPAEAANYTTNSAYHTNLNLLLSSLPTNTSPTGFFNGTRGTATSQVFALALCRGDLQPPGCLSCIDAAVQDLRQFCPNKMSATVWYDDCLMRFSEENFFSTSSGYERAQVSGVEVAVDPVPFKEQVRLLLDDVARRASDNARTLFAVGTRNFTNNTKLYGMAQCTRDLSGPTCYNCLKDEIRFVPAGQSGARMLGGSCFLRYESNPFYDLQAAAAAEAPTPAAPGSNGSMPTTNSTDRTTGGEKKSSNSTIVIIILALIIAVLFISLVACSYLRIKEKAKMMPARQDDVELHGGQSLPFDLVLLKNATNNFSEENKLGEGGFGPVYKGKLRHGQEIAVKRLARGSAQGLIELRNEVILVAKLQHRNLVKLLGWCLEEQEMLLVYEYLPNSSLDKFLYDPLKCAELDWSTRFKIIEGISRGLLYLHEDSRHKVVHRDLKASNILLDETMNPKISDFGLAKLFGGDQTHEAASRIAGTYGYMAPEYVMHGQYSTKSDVYSLGIMMIEIVTGQKNFGFQASGAIDLLNHVLQHWREGTVVEVVDRSLVGNCPIEEVIRCVHIALLCVQQDPSLRPSMSTVALMLSSHSVTLAAPAALAWGVTNVLRSSNGFRSRVTVLSEGELSSSHQSGDSFSQLSPR